MSIGLGDSMPRSLYTECVGLIEKSIAIHFPVLKITRFLIIILSIQLSWKGNHFH
jgi:hypothetical protein